MLQGRSYVKQQAHNYKHTLSRTKGIEVWESVRKHIHDSMTYSFITEDLPMIIIKSGSNILAATNLKTISR
jgi:hypothetical protein